MAAAFAPQGDRLVVASSNGRLALYDRNGRRVAALPRQSPLTTAAWSPDGRVFAAGSTVNATIWRGTRAPTTVPTGAPSDRALLRPDDAPDRERDAHPPLRSGNAPHEDPRSSRRSRRGCARPDRPRLRSLVPPRQGNDRGDRQRGHRPHRRTAPRGRDPVVRVQPRRAPPRHRQLRPHRTPLERRDRQAPPRPRASRLRPRRELLGGRVIARHGGLRRRRLRLGCRQRAARAPTRGSHRSRDGRRFQPGRERDRVGVDRLARAPVLQRGRSAAGAAGRPRGRRHDRRLRSERPDTRHRRRRRDGAALGRAARGDPEDDRQAALAPCRRSSSATMRLPSPAGKRASSRRPAVSSGR